MPPLGLLPMLGGISPTHSTRVHYITVVQCSGLCNETSSGKIPYTAPGWKIFFRCTLTRQLRGGATLLTKLATSRGVLQGTRRRGWEERRRRGEEATTRDRNFNECFDGGWGSWRGHLLEHGEEIGTRVHSLDPQKE